MATQKKGQGIAFKIPDHVDEPEVTSDPQAEVKPALPRTGVGMLSRMLNGAAADTEAVSKLNAEIGRTMQNADLRKTLLAQGIEARISSPQELAARLARELPADTTLALHGDLGVGKTTFVQGLARDRKSVV